MLRDEDRESFFDARGSKSNLVMSRPKYPLRPSPQRGYSAPELLVALVLLMITTAAALPNFTAALQNYRLMNDARSIAGQVALARVRAAADFTQAQVELQHPERDLPAAAVEQSHQRFLISPRVELQNSCPLG